MDYTGVPRIEYGALVYNADAIITEQLTTTPEMSVETLIEGYLGLDTACLTYSDFDTLIHVGCRYNRMQPYQDKLTISNVFIVVFYYQTVYTI